MEKSEVISLCHSVLENLDALYKIHNKDQGLFADIAEGFYRNNCLFAENNDNREANKQLQLYVNLIKVISIMQKYDKILTVFEKHADVNNGKGTVSFREIITDLEKC